MQELTGRLQALDPEASESLKVISYFDVLVNGKVSIEALLRAAATLTDCPCGYSPASGKPIRLCPNGERTAQAFPAQQGGLAFTMDDGGQLWLEREGAEHANDALVLERLALAIGIAQGRLDEPRRNLNLALEEETAASERAAAIAALGLTPHGDYRILACYPEAELPEVSQQTILSTRYGLIRAGIDKNTRAVLRTHPTPLGLGRIVQPGRLKDSWEAALVALLMASPSLPSVDATALGVAVHLIKLPVEALRQDPDVDGLASFFEQHSWAEETVAALCASSSLRAAASLLGLHHSTVQHRVTEIQQVLSIDPLTPSGVFRLNAARIALRLSQ